MNLLELNESFPIFFSKWKNRWIPLFMFDRWLIISTSLIILNADAFVQWMSEITFTILKPVLHKVWTHSSVCSESCKFYILISDTTLMTNGIDCFKLFIINAITPLRILTGKKHHKIKLQRLRKIRIWTFGSLVHQINSF